MEIAHIGRYSACDWRSSSPGIWWWCRFITRFQRFGSFCSFGLQDTLKKSMDCRFVYRKQYFGELYEFCLDYAKDGGSKLSEMMILCRNLRLLQYCGLPWRWRWHGHPKHWYLMAVAYTWRYVQENWNIQHRSENRKFRTDVYCLLFFFLSNNANSSAWVCSIVMLDDFGWWFGNYVEGSGRGPCYSTIPVFASIRIRIAGLRPQNQPHPSR